MLELFVASYFNRSSIYDYTHAVLFYFCLPKVYFFAVTFSASFWGLFLWGFVVVGFNALETVGWLIGFL